METKVNALPHFTLTRGTSLYRPTYTIPGNVTLEDPAIQVMTDLSKITALTIEPTASIDTANRKMIACRVRLLFVTNSDATIHGLITATDILGEKPLKYIQEHGGTREHILVQDIMTVQEKLEALMLNDVEKSNVGDIVETMKLSGRQHLLVVEKTSDQSPEVVRGLFSNSQISRQLGMNIELSRRANTFAELGNALASSF